MDDLNSSRRKPVSKVVHVGDQTHEHNKNEDQVLFRHIRVGLTSGIVELFERNAIAFRN